ncbi:hypothetical protein ACU686_31710 [Yinghuangia aomiensis]
MCNTASNLSHQQYLDKNPNGYRGPGRDRRELPGGRREGRPRACRGGHVTTAGAASRHRPGKQRAARSNTPHPDHLRLRLRLCHQPTWRSTQRPSLPLRSTATRPRTVGTRRRPDLHQRRLPVVAGRSTSSAAGPVATW